MSSSYTCISVCQNSGENKGNVGDLLRHVDQTEQLSLSDVKSKSISWQGHLSTSYNIPYKYMLPILLYDFLKFIYLLTYNEIFCTQNQQNQ